MSSVYISRAIRGGTVVKMLRYQLISYSEAWDERLLLGYLHFVPWCSIKIWCELNHISMVPYFHLFWNIVNISWDGMSRYRTLQYNTRCKCDACCLSDKPVRAASDSLSFFIVGLFFSVLCRAIISYCKKIANGSPRFFYCRAHSKDNFLSSEQRNMHNNHFTNFLSDLGITTVKQCADAFYLKIIVMVHNIF